MDVDQLEAEDFLDIVWGDRKSWVDLPAKVGAYWVPYYMRWPADAEMTIRIDSCIRDGESLYFSAAQFSERGRDYEDMLPSHWLWADLDEVHPTEAADLGFMPTLAWESSPGRYQCMWRLHKKLRPEKHEIINQALSYFLGADQGGWDRTQVLRLPGTRNWKYPDGPPVRWLWYEEGLSYPATRIWDAVKASAPRLGVTASPVQVTKRNMPARARALLRVGADQVVEGERSARLWELECLLAESGWGEDDIYAVVEASAWNKWAEVRTGERRLRREIAKAIRHVASKGATPPGGEEDAVVEEDEGSQLAGPTLPWVRYNTFLATELPEPKWLVEDIWTAESHGIVGGEPKSSKTGMLLALGLSVASGKPFLRKYPVHTPGPVLMIQEENAQWMVQDRLRKLARYYGLIGRDDYEVEYAPKGSLGEFTVELQFPADVPMYLLNNYSLDLTNEDHQDGIVAAIERYRPVLVILDPLYLIFGGLNTDRAENLYPFLSWLLKVRNEYHCAIAIAHHMGKKPQGSNVTTRSRGGQRLLGSTTLHGWCDSAIYCEQVEDQRSGWVGSRMELEFRSMAPRRPLDVRLFWGEPGNLDMKAEVQKYDLTGAIMELIRGEPGISAVKAARVLEVDKRTVLGRARDPESPIIVEGGGPGRGRTNKLYLSENGNAQA